MPDRSVVVTAELQNAIRRDVIRYALRQPSTVIPLVLTAVAVLVIVVATGDAATLAARLVVAIVLVVVMELVLVNGTRRRMARAVDAVFPVGSTATASAGDDALRVSLARGSATTPWTTFRSIAVRPEIVLLRVRDTRVTNMVPRVLLDEDDLSRMRARIGSTV